MVVFPFNTEICVFLLEEAIYSYCYLCILIVILCILIASLYILIVVYVFLLFVYVFLDAAILTEVFPCFFLSCKANVRV